MCQFNYCIVIITPMPQKFNYIHKLKMLQSRKIVKNPYNLISDRFKSRNYSSQIKRNQIKMKINYTVRTSNCVLVG